MTALLKRNDQEALWQIYQSDPRMFCEDFFHEPPREWQPEALDMVAEHEWVAIAACRKAGKSRFAAMLAIWFLVTQPDSLVMTIAPIWSQVKDAIWAEIRSLWSKSPISKIPPYSGWEVMQTEIQTHDPLWRAIGLTSSKPENIEGRHGKSVLVILDESKGIPDEFFDSIQGMLSDGVKVRLVVIGTAGIQRGFFYKAFSTERSLWKTKQIRSSEIPRLQKKYESERIRLGENNPWFRMQQCAEFTGAGSDSPFTLEKIEAAIKRSASTQGPKVMSLDPAGSGKDSAVLSFREGYSTLKMEASGEPDTMKQAAWIIAEANIFMPNIIVVDSSGLGKGPYDRIKELSTGRPWKVVGFNSGHSPRDKERFLNCKAESIFHLADLFNKDLIHIPDIPELVEDLLLWQVASTSNGKTKIVDPDDSPDYGDSLMMAFSESIKRGPLVHQYTPSFL